MRSLRLCLFVLWTGISVVPSTLYAQTVAVPKPKEIDSIVRSDHPLGSGTYTYFLMTIYDASLWTDAPSWSMQTSFALSLHYNIHIQKGDLIDRTISEMKKTQPLSDEQVADYENVLDHFFPMVNKGDTLTAVYSPPGTIRLFHNGELSNSIDNVEFAQRFFGIWLSEQTSAPDLRRELLALPPL